LHGGLRWAARTLQYELLWPTRYNGVPRFDELDAAFWARRSGLIGVDLPTERAFEYIQDELAEHVTDFAPSTVPRGDRFYLPNDGFKAVDATLLWIMLRRYKPQRVLELGCGFSSLLIADALAANSRDGHDGRHSIIDPSPVLEPPAGTLRRMPAQAVPMVEFSSLESDDVLFIDTTHTVKIGGEVTHIVLEIIPRLASGVIVHFHDIFLPYEYPRDLTQELGYHWAEQYLLHAFLAYNAEVEVLIPAHMLARDHGGRLEELIGVANTSASSFWLRRR
jgi:hypothetical protein